jgi:hypothetical protein
LINLRLNETVVDVASSMETEKQFASRGGFRQGWRSISRPLRLLVLVCFPLGLLLAIFGLLGDIFAWWSDFPFSTNLASSLTGALFGIPLALAFLQRLSAMQNDLSDRDSTRREGRLVATRLHEAVLHVVDDDFYRTAPPPDMNLIKKKLVVAAIPTGGALALTAEVVDHLRAFKRIIETEGGRSGARESAWDEAHVSALYLREHMKGRYMRHFATWIPVDLDVDLGDLFLSPNSAFPEDITNAVAENRTLDKFIGEDEATAGRYYYQDLEDLGRAVDQFQKYADWRSRVRDAATKIRQAIEAI